MDEMTKLTALDKLASVSHKIGYPEFVTDPAQLDLYYAQLVITHSNFENRLNVGRFEVARNRQKLGRTPDKDEWQMTPAQVNAYYEPSVNEVVIPAGILQPPIYSQLNPMSLIFGSLGFIIGHELTHGFDNTGRQYDRHGNMVDWWGNASSQQFTDLSQCFVDEYNNFIIYGQHANGQSTLGENLADNGGLKISYNALSQWLEMNGFSDATLPGLNMTLQQQFFLSFAQTWCAYTWPEYAVQLIVLDVHSNARDRVNGVLRNMPQFASVFECPATSAMNPSNKCSLW
jgi:predicted metalloendopeptidase